MTPIKNLATGLFACMLLLCLPAQAAYYPLKIVNNTAQTNKDIHAYISFMAQDTTAATNFCALQLTYNPATNMQVASLVKIQQQTNSGSYTYRLDSLQGYNAQTNSINILIPNTISGRCVVSLNYPLYMPTVQTGDSMQWVFQDPSVSNTSDVNYDIIYDKFEFTYDNTNTMYIDPTAVDFFAIPIGLKSSTGVSGATTKAKRDALLKTISGVFNDGIDNKWAPLVIKDSATVLRITAPNLAPGFDTAYLAQSGFNYIDSLIEYYQSNILRINCSELNVAGDEIFDKYNVSPSQDTGAYIFTSQPIANGLWIFTNNPASGSPIVDTINMNTVNSNNFFGPGTAPFVTTNKMVISIIVKNITAAFTVGLLPAPNGMMLDSSYLNNPKKYPYYKTNRQLKAPAKTGPWYNLYTQALHKAIPQIYAFAFDDVLGQSGTLVSTNNADTISVTLGDMGNTTIPAHNGLLPVYAATLTYNSGFTHIGNQYIDTLRWIVPNNQPSNAQYFFMGNGPDFTIPPQQFLSYQYNNLYPGTATMGWVAIPDSLIGQCSNTLIPMTINTCGGPANPCPTNAGNWKNFYNAASSALLPGIDSVSLPATITSNSGFTQSGGNYVATISWHVPPGQPSTAQYFFMGAGPGFATAPDSFVYYQLDSLYSSQDTTGTLTVPVSFLNSSSLDSVSIQVFTCGGPGHPCPTKVNVSYWQCDEGSNLLYPSAATLQSRKRKKK